MSHATKPARLLVAGRPQPARMPALVILVYAAAVYLFFLAVLGYAAGFFAGFGVPKGIDQGPRAAVPAAVATDLLLLLLFAVQHTVMARPWFKRRWTRIVPEPAERASFVLAASLVLALLFWLWQPVGGTVWHLSGPGAAALWAVYAAGWAMAVSSTFLISHFDLFGLRQAWLHARRARYSPPAFIERGVYGRIRHPLMAGFVVIFWSAPVMTAGHLLFAAVATGYILAGIAFEEHDLIRSLGGTYAAYRARVPALIPRPWPRRLTGVPEGRTVVLRDGSAVLIRQVRSTDAAPLADGFGRLSAASRQMRFLGVKKELSAAELRYFTDVDHHDHEALAAVDRADGQGVGIARYVRDAGDPQAAEIAVTIVDDWQGRGLGTELLAALSDRARQEGIRRLTALADAGNVAVAALLRNAGARLVRRERGTVEYEITLARGAERECALSPAACT